MPTTETVPVIVYESPSCEPSTFIDSFEYTPAGASGSIVVIGVEPSEPQVSCSEVWVDDPPPASPRTSSAWTVNEAECTVRSSLTLPGIEVGIVDHEMFTPVL